MLYLVGVGLYDEKDVTLRGVEAIERCEEVYLETYTSPWRGKEGLEELVERDIQEFSRSDLEENVDELVEEAFEKDVAVLVPGDPLVATTHGTVVTEARKEGVTVRLVHGPSIYSAIASTGLSIYKFGKTCTIPRPKERYEPTSFYDVILDNQRIGAHTLCLLDVGEDPMTVREAVERLEAAEEDEGSGVIRPSRKLVAASFSDMDTVAYETVEELRNTAFPSPAALVVPGELREMEEKALKE